MNRVGREVDDDEAGLREVLREWTVPGPPAEVEERLRITLRLRRVARRPLAWRAVAAGLALVAAVLLVFVAQRRSPRPPVVRQAPPEAPAAALPAPSAVVPVTPTDEATVPRGPVRRNPVPSPLQAAGVAVEPDQRELLLQLARAWKNARLAPPAVSVPRLEVLAADAPAARVAEASAPGRELYPEDTWEEMGGPWPSGRVSRSVDGGGKR